MFGDWRFQQGVPCSQFARRSVLRDEGDAEAVHLLEPEGEFSWELERYLYHAEPSLCGEAESLLRNSPFRLLCALV